MSNGDPLWYKDAIIYELHVKAFFDSTNDGIGDFPGLTQKLDYLQDLGITCIWLLPFFPSPLRDDGYDVSDYRSVHARYGSLEHFQTFVRAAHERHIKVLGELIVNHTSDQHPWFQAARSAPPDSPARAFYVWSETGHKYHDARIIFTDSETSNWTWDPVAQAYYWHRFFHHQPDLNFDNPAVRQAILDVMCYWLDMGVDGFRCDAVPYLFEREGTNCENLSETHAYFQELRREIERRYPARMLLAEANQWPADVRAYFADGDEFHMAFHFPLMPRVFMALRQEDRYPIVEILKQTPEIPETCQWSIFLRNHDELTLEMVTDKERDYMYRMYAADPQMRINIGIRRRLAPLVGNNRRRIELLNSLLLTLPGTPVIYYGDEIGMGDNIYLGDRNGVRTPMQWTSDRNAGFSRADPAKLYSPPLMDPVYGYQAVNVEAQERDPSSLLNWMKRSIALRKRYQVFGRGSLEFLHPKNRKVLVYLRRYQDDVVLCVANLSRFVQPVELDLSAFAGWTPIEMLGRTEFPPIGVLPYFLTPGPYAFYSFQLQRPAPVAFEIASLSTDEIGALPMLTVNGDWEVLFEDAGRETLEKVVLPQFLVRQPWFSRQAHTLKAIRIADWTTVMTGAPPAFLMIVDVENVDGRTESYLLPLGVATGSGANALAEFVPGCILARVNGARGEGFLHDALADDVACGALLAAISERRELITQLGAIYAFPLTAEFDAHLAGQTLPQVRRNWEPKSHTAVQYGKQLLLKLFRRLEPGPHPDFELKYFLTEQTRFDHLPQVIGAFAYHRSGQEPTTLALLQTTAPSHITGWDYTLDELKRYFERASSNIPSLETTTLKDLPLHALTSADAPGVVRETVGEYLAVAAILGQRTAELHDALTGAAQNSALAPEPFTGVEFSSLVTTLQTQMRTNLQVLEQNLWRLPNLVSDEARQVLHKREQLEHRLSVLAATNPSATKIRCHGNYHLKKVLWDENDFFILDFEGNLTQSFAARRVKQSPLVDVATMLHSFSRAAYVSLFECTEDRPDDFERLEPWARVWLTWTVAAFVRAYRSTATNASFLPSDSEQFQALLQLFLLDQTVQELQETLDHRPDWLHVPLRDLLSFCSCEFEQGQGARL